MHIKKGDLVQIISGNGRKEGGPAKVLQVLPAENRVVVEGRRLKKKHIRANKATGEQGSIRAEEGAIHVSNVMLYSEKIGKAVRTQSRYVGADGRLFSSKAEALASFDVVPARVKKVRYAAKSDEIFE